jgi:flagellar biosynthetic protein FliR
VGEVMGIFNFDDAEMLSFFAVLVRYSVLIAVLPFIGDRFVPTSVKVLLSLSITIALFPALVSGGFVQPKDSLTWGASASGLVGTIALEVLFALILGFTAKMAFEGVNFGGNLIGNFMGFSMATTYDPSMESQTQIVAEIQMALAMLTFLALDGHHLMLQASFQSYELIGVGGLGLLKGAGFNLAFSQKLIALSGQVILYGIQLAAPVAVSLFAVNVVFGIMSKAMPQLNILILSFSVSALIGLIVMFLSLPEFQEYSAQILGSIPNRLREIISSMKQGK